MNRVDASFKEKLKPFGVGNWNECFHCGNCTAICPLSDEQYLFPRKGIRMLQMGLKDKVERSLDPWMCYYCGECTESCPRDANPGELMMTLRRYLTSVYDWTGISRLFYTKKFWEIGFVVIFALLIVTLFAVFLPPNPALFSNPAAFINDQGGVMINGLSAGIANHQFVDIIETGDWIMAIIVGLLLISNIFAMWYKVILSDPDTRIPFLAYFSEFWKLIAHFTIQPKFSKCDDKKYWTGHFLLMSGYTIMFIMIVALLPKFQIEEITPWYNWQRLLGYYATIGILFFLINVFISRIRRANVKMQFSHASDWLFIVLLFLTTVSGILIHIFRLNGLPLATYFTYVCHLAILVPMIMVEVPFSKWSHLAYRPFAVYFSALRKAAAEKAVQIQVATA
jgi:ferredoxin